MEEMSWHKKRDNSKVRWKREPGGRMSELVINKWMHFHTVSLDVLSLWLEPHWTKFTVIDSMRLRKLQFGIVCPHMTRWLHPSGWHGCDSSPSLCAITDMSHSPFSPSTQAVQWFLYLLLCRYMFFSSFVTPSSFIYRMLGFLLLFSTCLAPSHYVPLLHFSVWFISDQRFVLSSYFSWQRNHLDLSYTGV